MNVTEALKTRITCRAFKPEAPSERVVRKLLDTARWAPSGGNLQPWHVYALTGQPLSALMSDVARQADQYPMGLPPEYAVYPAPLKDPYNTRRRQCGEDMYASIGVTREDKPGRMAQFRQNFAMFGAPVGLFVYLDRSMGPPQWSDVGMFLQSLMLAAREEGLHTAPQEAWAMWKDAVTAATGAPEDLMLFCGVGLGWMDERAAINKLRTSRADVDEFTTFKGFGA